MSSLRRKLQSRRGFTVTEMMACVVILLLATGVVVQTLQLGIAHFERHTRASEAQLLCNTLSLEVRDQLACAGSVVKKDGASLVKFTSGADGADAVPCAFVEQDGKLCLQYYQESGEPLSTPFSLVPDSDYLENGMLLRARLAVTCEGGGFKAVLAVADDFASPTVQAEKTFTVKPVREVEGLG